jgi:environmental stress-induced protein Ves
VSARFERFDLRTIAAQAWKNGAGVTREIAVSPCDDGEAGFDWRISVAEVDRDVPFSAFPGIDRCIVLLSGAGMGLASVDGAIALRLDRPFAPLRFSGDIAFDAALIDGACRDFNVMTRRGAWRSEVDCIDHAARVAGDAPGLLLCCVGRWQIDVPGIEALAPSQGLRWNEPVDGFGVTPLEAGTLLWVRLCQDRTA